jgi:uncharacterized protein YkwD
MKLKLKNLISSLLVFALALAAAAPAALAGTEPDVWAKPETDKANTSGLLTDSAAADFQRKMTRDQYCEIVVRFIEKTLGKELPLPAGLPFTDSRSEHVLKAYQYGVAEGMGDGKFEPDSPVQRQQIATFMKRALDKMQSELGRTLLDPPVSSLTFEDSAKVADWAMESMRYAVSNGIFKGDDTNNVNPEAAITSQECVAVAIRSFEASQTKINAALTTSQLIDKAADSINIGYALGDLPSAVSRNIILPASGAGGAKITWQSSNASVIDSGGRVTANPGGTVTLTATLTLSGLSRVRTFTLTTTSLTGDQLLVQNARTALELGFGNSGDSVNYVTGRVFLPGTVLGLPVTWYSDTPGVVAVNGDVTLPGNSLEVTVNLQASFKSGGASGTKVFALKVRNPAYSSGSVSLHNVSLGMTASQVTSALGSYKTALTLSTGETWQLYYSSTTSYNNFIAVAFQSSRVVGVYTMVQGWENYLRDAQTSRVITTAEANGIENMSLTVYTDSRGGGTVYAGFLADTSASADNVRTLSADGAETFTLALVNAFRARNSRSPLSSDSALARSARLHSADMGQYGYFSATGRTGTTYQTRASTAASALGVAVPTVEGGFIGSNTINPFNYVDIAVNDAADRALMLSSTATSAGAGFAGGYSGTYRDLLTVVFGRGSLVTGVTLTVNGVQQSGVSVNVNGTQNITLTFSPSNATEAVTVSSSNTNIFTITQYSSTTTNTRTYTVTGKAQTSTYGSAYIYVYGADGRQIAYFPVTVGNAYASGLTVRDSETSYSTVTGSTANPSVTMTKTYVIGTGNTYQFISSIQAASGSPSVTWSSSNTSIASVGTGGLVTGSYQGTAQIYASVPSGSGTIRVTINVVVVNMTLTTSKTSITPSETANITATLSTSPSGLTLQGFTWVSSNTSAAAVTGSGTSPATVTGKAAGTVSITATAAFAASTQYVWRVAKSVNITVAGAPDYPTSASVNPTSLTIEKGKTGTFTVTTTPASVTNKVITHNYSGNDLTVSVSNGNINVTGNNVTSASVSFTIMVKTSSSGSVFPIQVSVTVTKIKTNIAITNAPPSLTAGDALTLSASKDRSDNTGAITWSLTSDANSAAIATIDPATGRLTTTGAGTVTVKAYVAAWGDFDAAEQTATIIINSAPVTTQPTGTGA